MKTTFDVIDVIWTRLNSVITGQITGKVYKNFRPLNSKLEDIVINSLPITDDYFQRCVINVNCYSPTKSVKIDGVMNAITDNVRLNEITKLVTNNIKEVFEPTFHYHTSTQSMIREEVGNEMYSNIRIEFMFTEPNP